MQQTDIIMRYNVDSNCIQPCRPCSHRFRRVNVNCHWHLGTYILTCIQPVNQTPSRSTLTDSVSGSVQNIFYTIFGHNEMWSSIVQSEPVILLQSPFGQTCRRRTTNNSSEPVIVSKQKLTVYNIVVIKAEVLSVAWLICSPVLHRISSVPSPGQTPKFLCVIFSLFY